MQDLFLTVKDLSVLMGVDERTIYKWAKTIPGYIKYGGSVRFNRQTFLKHAEGYKPAEKSSRTSMGKHGLI